MHTAAPRRGGSTHITHRLNKKHKMPIFNLNACVFVKGQHPSQTCTATSSAQTHRVRACVCACARVGKYGYYLPPLVSFLLRLSFLLLAPQRRCLPLLLPGLGRSSAGAVGCCSPVGQRQEEQEEQRGKEERRRRRQRAGLTGAGGAGARLAEGDAVVRIASERI